MRTTTGLLRMAVPLTVASLLLTPMPSATAHSGAVHTFGTFAFSPGLNYYDRLQTTTVHLNFGPGELVMVDAEGAARQYTAVIGKCELTGRSHYSENIFGGWGMLSGGCNAVAVITPPGALSWFNLACSLDYLRDLATISVQGTCRLYGDSASGMVGVRGDFVMLPSPAVYPPPDGTIGGPTTETIAVDGALTVL